MGAHVYLDAVLDQALHHRRADLAVGPDVVHAMRRQVRQRHQLVVDGRRGERVPGPHPDVLVLEFRVGRDHVHDDLREYRGEGKRAKNRRLLEAGQRRVVRALNT